MGILYDAVIEQKRQFLIQRLTSRGILITQTGRSIQDSDYDELHYEFVLSEFKEIDIKADSNKWF